MLQSCRNRLKIEQNYKTPPLILVQNYMWNSNEYPTFSKFIDLLLFIYSNLNKRKSVPAF